MTLPDKARRDAWRAEIAPGNRTSLTCEDVLALLDAADLVERNEGRISEIVSEVLVRRLEVAEARLAIARKALEKAADSMHTVVNYPARDALRRMEEIK